MDLTSSPGHLNHQFVAEDAATLRPATEMTPNDMNGPMNELVNIILAAQIVPDANNHAQVLDAIKHLIQRGGNYALDTGVANAYVIALNPVITAYTGNFFWSFKAAHANTGASTVDFGAGPVALNNDVGGALAAGDITAGMVVSGNYSLADNQARITSMVQSRGDARYGSSPFNVGATVAANSLTGTLNPCKLDFRNAILTSGASINYNLVAALSCVVPSGATLGTTNGVAARLVWLVAYNAGAPVLCVVNQAGGVQLDETNLISPTTISAGATSANVIYSASAVAANSPYKVVCVTDITEAAAGTWATAPTMVQGIGGQALAAMSSLGYGQTWQAVTRNSGTNYYNTTGKPIMWVLKLENPATAHMYVDGVDVSGGTGLAMSGTAIISGVIVPPGKDYQCIVAGGSYSSVELR